jgi:hypothetical protein
MSEFPMGGLFSIENKAPANSYPLIYKAPTLGPGPTENVTHGFPSQTSHELTGVDGMEAKLQESKVADQNKDNCS